MRENSNRVQWDQAAQQETYKIFQDIYDTLSEAYWTANTMRDKDYIRGIADVVFEILTDLNRQAIEDRSPEFEELKQSIAVVMPRFEKIKEEIDNIIQSVRTATEVAKAVDKGIGIAAKLFV